MARVTVRTPRSSNNSQEEPISTAGARQPTRPPCLPLILQVGTIPPQERYLRRPNQLHLTQLRRSNPTTCLLACRGKRWRQWVTGSPRRCSNRVTKGLGHIIQRLLFIPLSHKLGVAAVMRRFKHVFFCASLGRVPLRIWLHNLDLV